MTIASEISRLQWAKTNIRTAIQNKWVTVPASAKYDNYAGYINQIQTWVPQEQYDAMVLMAPNSYRDTDSIRNSEYTPRVIRNLPDIINADSSKYFHYFILENSETSADKYNISVAVKSKWWDFWRTESAQIDPGNPNNYGAHWTDFRVKRSWNDVIASILYYIDYDSYNWHTYVCQTYTYYCVNITNSTFSSIINLWVYSCSPSEEDMATIYSDWQTSCWISAAESVYWIDWWLWLTSLSVDRGSTRYLYDLVITLNNN